MEKIKIIGAGLAGCEAALYLAQKKFKVELYEMRPNVETKAHSTSNLAEFVCSNSLGATALTSASGLLKQEMKLLGGHLINIAFDKKVPSGASLSIDRLGFSTHVTELIENNPNITVIRDEVTQIPKDYPCIVATGPLTSKNLVDDIKKLTGSENFHFFDAIAPIVKKESINFEKAFWASRWDKGTPDFINCPMTKDEYENFYKILTTAEKIELKKFEKDPKFFEGCLPVEVIASRGFDTLRFGPLKPVGLTDKRYPNEKFFAVVQLRQDDKIASLYNLVGFQTNLKWGEQKRLMSAIPGLENAEITRYGVMHANTFINSPRILNPTLECKIQENLFFAGQLTGVEGYNESMATGLFAGINMARKLNGQKPLILPPSTMLGALLEYITYPDHKHFQPVNSNWGIVSEMEMDRKIRKNKEAKNTLLSNRAIDEIKKIIESN